MTAQMRVKATKSSGIQARLKFSHWTFGAAAAQKDHNSQHTATRMVRSPHDHSRLLPSGNGAHAIMAISSQKQTTRANLPKSWNDSRDGSGTSTFTTNYDPWDEALRRRASTQRFMFLIVSGDWP